MSSTTRVGWIDVCKAMAIMIVAWVHFGIPSILSPFIHQFIMPVFYFCSGIFYRPEKYSSSGFFLKKKAQSLLVPYFCMGILIYVIWTVVYLVFLPDKVVGPWEYAGHLFWHNTESVPGIWGGVQWFLTSLFFTEVLVFLTERGLKNKYLLLLFFTALGVSIIILANNSTDFWIPLAFDTALVMPVFYCIGYLVADRIQDWLRKSRMFHLYLIFLVSAAVSFQFDRLNQSTNVRKIEFGNPLYYYLGAFFGVVMFVCFAVLVDRIISGRAKLYSWMKYIGVSTIVILYVHRQFDGINKTLLESVFRITLTGGRKYLYFGASLIVFFAIAAPVCRWIDRHLGFLFWRFPNKEVRG